jgi:hypothetical protein
LHLSHLIDLERLAFRLQKKHIGMDLVVNLPARDASITGIRFISPSLEAVQGLCKLQGHLFLSHPLVSHEEVAVNDPVVDNGLLK